MAGQIRRMIDRIVEVRAKGNPGLAATTKTKLLLKGIDSSAYTSSSADNPEVIKKLEELARDLGISL